MANPITPPPGLIDQLIDALHGSRGHYDYESRLVMAGYVAGANQELEACCKWTAIVGGAEALRAARRPKPPSLKEEALEALERMQDLYPHMHNKATIRRALEALDD